MKKIALFVSAVLVSGAMANLAHADELYLGSKLGYNRFNDACYLNAPCDDESFAVSGHLGYRFTPYVAAEYGVNYTFHSEKAPTPAPVVNLVETVPVTQLVVHHYPAQTRTVPFDLEGATLKDATPLNDVVELLNAYPEAQVEIIGYSDATGSAAYNQQLTEQRAQSVAAQFIALGISEDRLSVQGLGEANPVASNDTRQGREANRRVEITVPSFQYEMIESVTK